MTRRAILIDAGGTPDKKGHLPGTTADVRAISSFLMSNPGGAWESSEIVILKDPSKYELRENLAAGRDHDYSFVAGAGHGHHIQGQGIDETRFCYNASDEIAAHDLNTGASRCTVMLDCCRHVTKYEPISVLESRSKALAKYAADRSTYLYRTAFDRTLSETESGCSYLYSCDLNQSAQESQAGGYYTQALIDSALSWHEGYRDGSPAVFDIWDAHNRASKRVTERESQQIPQSQFGRRQRFFPFAVVPLDSVARRLILN